MAKIDWAISKVIYYLFKKYTDKSGQPETFNELSVSICSNVNK